MNEAQPALPDPSDLAVLDPVVAVAFLVTVLSIALLAFFGPTLKARLAPKAKPQDTPTEAAALPAALPAVIDRTGSVTADYIASLKDQIEFLRSQLSDLHRECDSKDREIQRLNDDLQQRRRGGR